MSILSCIERLVMNIDLKTYEVYKPDPLVMAKGKLAFFELRYFMEGGLTPDEFEVRKKYLEEEIEVLSRSVYR